MSFLLTASKIWRTLVGCRHIFPYRISYLTGERSAASRVMICFDSIKASEGKSYFFSLSGKHRKIIILHLFLFWCCKPKREAFYWKCNSQILDIRERYFVVWHFAELRLPESLKYIFPPCSVDKREDYNATFNSIFIQVSLMSLICTITIFMFGDWKYKWNWILKKVLWSNFHTLNQEW